LRIPLVSAVAMSAFVGVADMLSETKHVADVPIVDITAWSERSVEWGAMTEAQFARVLKAMGPTRPKNHQTIGLV
jgi:hypothetical protein